MATTADDGEPTFVDTNILVYATVPAAPMHAQAVARLSEFAAAGAELWISRQVLREYLAVLSRPQTFTSPLDADALAEAVERLEARFRVAEDGPTVTACLLALIRAVPCGGKQVHDANIVATMQAHGIPRLLTHNVADFRRFGGLIVVSALTTPP